MSRTVTGRTRAGEPMTIECREWCDGDHDRDWLDDTFHHSKPIMIVPPADPLAEPEYAIVPQMRATLMAHATSTLPGVEPCIYLELDRGARAVELDLAGADEVLAELDAYRAALAAMRDQLAEARKEVRS